MKFNIAFLLCIITILSYSQTTVVKKDTIKRVDSSKAVGLIRPDVFSLGLGFGLDYGGIGINFTAYPHKYIGLFAGGGTALAGFGYNAGIKIRYVKTSSKKVQVVPFALGMYGYNTSIIIANNTTATDYNRLFYGLSFGFGTDIRFRRGYISAALLFPIRGNDVDNYITDLQNNHHVQFQNDLSTVTFSIGYHFVLNFE